MLSDKGFSMVICTYNGEKRLPKTLENLSKLTIPKNYFAEIILVDNASTDNTKTSAKEYWKDECRQPYSLRVIEEKRPGKGYAVETGYDAAKYSYILTADDDNWLQEDYLLNALKLFQMDSEIGILQAKSVGVFETPPPEWLERFKRYFIIGSPISETGYFPPKNCWVWGAGMIIKKADWDYIRHLGFSFLTSKIYGKATGEDNETAIALLMMGRKIYYSDHLLLKHFMPSGRITWKKLKKNFEFFGHVSYYLFLYKIVIDAYNSERSIQPGDVKKRFPKYWLKRMKAFGYLEHIKYLFKFEKSLRQLNLIQCYSMGKNYFNLKEQSDRDIQMLCMWMFPLLKSNTTNFEYPF